MLNERIVRYGTGNLGITVNGIRGLVSVNGPEQRETAEALAVAIAAIGPEGVRVVTPPPVVIEAERPVTRQKRFTVGQQVWCTVSAIRGWKTVTEVSPKDGRIKIDGGRVWCPLHNFEESCPSWQASA